MSGLRMGCGVFLVDHCEMFRGILLETLKELISLPGVKDGENLLVEFEFNRRYNNPSDEWIDLARDYQMNFVRGGDCHCVDEMK